jgi:hypothetical protein
MSEDIDEPINNLPAIIPVHDIVIPADLSFNSTINQAKQNDVDHANQMLKVCYHSLTKATSVSALMRVVAQSMSVVEKRRHLMCLQYGDSSQSRSSAFTPIED